nr:MAG TPA: hypothetical protein [Caudoviricetes sp.]
MSVTGRLLTAVYLKALLTDALVYRGIAQNFNNFDAGVYTYVPDTKNIPEGLNAYGMLIVFQSQSNAFQIAISQFGDIFTRMKWNEYVRDWKVIQANVLTT